MKPDGIGSTEHRSKDEDNEFEFAIDGSIIVDEAWLQAICVSEGLAELKMSELGKILDWYSHGHLHGNYVL